MADPPCILAMLLQQEFYNQVSVATIKPVTRLRLVLHDPCFPQPLSVEDIPNAECHDRGVMSRSPESQP
jgi:hypothetical protein